MAIAEELTTGLFAPILGQLDPVRIGELERGIKISIEYGKRIARDHLQGNALNRLVTEYSSHGFVIDRQEARSLLTTVREAYREESTAGTNLLELAQGLWAQFADPAIASTALAFIFVDNLLKNEEGTIYERDSSDSAQATDHGRGGRSDGPTVSPETSEGDDFERGCVPGDSGTHAESASDSTQAVTLAP